MESGVTSVEQVLLEVWQKHVYAEFAMRDAKAALATMTDCPYVLAHKLATEEPFSFYAGPIQIQQRVKSSNCDGRRSE